MNGPSPCDPVPAQMQALLDEMAELRRRVADLEADAAGESPGDGLAPSSVPDEAADTRAATLPGEGPMRAVSRRAMLLGAAGAAATAASAAAVVTGATPAAANSNGQSWTLGGSNSATATTGLAASVNGFALAVQNDSSANTGDTGGAAGFSATSDTSTQTALKAEHYGEGYALSAASWKTDGTQDTASIFTEGRGRAAVIAGYNNSSNSPTLSVYAASASAVAAEFKASLAQVRLTPRITPGPPSNDAFVHSLGSLVEDPEGNLWLCTVDGSTTFRKLAGPATAGALHVLPAPVRVYDSRPGTSPSTGPKTPLAAATARVLDMTVNSSGVPKGATAVMCNLLVVNAVAGSGNLTIWANGVAHPSANNMVWGGSAGRFSSLAVTAVDHNAKCQVMANVKTDFVLDVVGYYL